MPRLLALVLIAGAIVIGEIAGLARLASDGRWIATNSTQMYDFAPFWVAGRLTIEGNPAGAYDWSQVAAAEIELAGGNTRFSPYSNPPPFLLVMAPLALLPYHIAFVVFIGLSALFYAMVIGSISGKWSVPAALAAPPVIICAFVGQNGLLSAGLIGLALLLMERRPAIGGAVLALMTYKPQFGLLFPVALAGGRKWLAIGGATGGIAAVLGLCWGLLGWSVFPAALGALERVNSLILVEGAGGWHKLQSLYGFLRAVGAGHLPALIAQGGLALACAAWLWGLWRGDSPYDLKAAGLAAGSLLATPFVLNYDFTILWIGFAFLWRDRPFDGREWVVFGLANLMFAPALIGKIWPLGFLASLAVLALIRRRLARS